MSDRAKLDPRIWNLVVAGLSATVGVVGAGCGEARGPLEINGEPESETTVVTAEAEAEAEVGTDDQCQTSSDCPYSYVCVNGICEYEGYDDGHWNEGYECVTDWDCGVFEHCDFECTPDSGTPLPSCGGNLLPIPTLLDVGESDTLGEVLELQFADLDDDAKDELIAVRGDELRVYDADQEQAIVSSIQPGASIVDAATGQLDLDPGEDLLIVLDSGRQVYSSLGDGSFALPAYQSSQGLTLRGVVVGDFDGLPPEDQLLHGAYGASLELGDGQFIELLVEPDDIGRAAVLDHTAPALGYVLGAWGRTWFFDAAHVLQASRGGFGDGPLAGLTAADGTPVYLFDEHYAGWTAFSVSDTWGTSQAVRPLFSYDTLAVEPADLEGDGVSEWVMLAPSRVAIWRMPLAAEECLEHWPLHEYDGQVSRIAVGDYDGDGDDEVAVATTLDEIVLLSP